MKAFLRTLLAVLIADVLLVAVLALYLASKLEQQPHVERGSVLVQTLNGEIPESSPPGAMPFMSGALSHTAIIDNLEKARHDERIKAVVLRIGAPAIGWAKVGEIRQRVRQLQAAGKPVWAYTEWLTGRALFLAGACDSIALMTKGYVSLHGMAAEQPFVKGLVDKLGLEPDLDYIGAYKSAAQMVLRKDMSEPVRDNVNWMLDELYPHFVQTVEEDRHLEPGQLESKAMGPGVLVPEEALQLGLVDRLAYWDEVEAALLRIPGVEAAKQDHASGWAPRPRTISGEDYAKISRANAGIAAKHKIAVVHATGLIGGEESGWVFPLGVTMGAATMEQAFREAATDDELEAIIFRVDSGGGESSTSWRIQRAALRAQAVKPVVVSMLDIAASGGYIICYPCSTLAANPYSVVGSIGSISGKVNMRGLYDKLGITKDFVTRGPNALMNSDYFNYTDEQFKSFKERHWEDYRAWVENIADVRHKTFQEIDDVGRGRVFTGQQARALGLVDTLGTFDLAVAIAKQRAGIPADEEVDYVHFPKKKGFLEALRSGGFGALLHAAVDAVTKPLEQRGVWAVDPNSYR
jgi:protease-4